MTAWNSIIAAWDWEPTVVLGCLALLVGYSYAVSFHFTRRSLYFLVGDVVILLALVSPLDTLGDHYLLSAHMLQHLLLVLVVPPLLLMAIPDFLWLRAKRWAFCRLCDYVLSLPAVAWLIGVLTLTVWHWPLLYEAALQSESIHVVEHLCFLASATVFWYPVIVGAAEHHLSAPGATMYFMAAGMANTLLAILIAFSPRVLYPTYLQPTDPQGILFLIRHGWGISALGDQEIAGLMMWVPGSFPYLIATFAILIRWFSDGEKTETKSQMGV